MIIELGHSDFHLCRSLLNNEGQLEAKAVIEGVAPGRVYVDDASKPTSGIVWLGNNDGFIFIGNEANKLFNNSLNSFIDNVIANEAKIVGLDCFEAIGNHNKWDAVLEVLFVERDIKSWNQKVYTLDRSDLNVNVQLNLEEGYEIVKLTESLYKNETHHRITNIEYLHEKILEFWSLPEHFFNEGLGYCALFNYEIVSICFSGFVVNKTHCIDIETNANHRGKKLAQTLTHLFAEECLNQNCTPYWDCMESNTASRAVVERNGFKNIFNYKGYYFMLK